MSPIACFFSEVEYILLLRGLHIVKLYMWAVWHERNRINYTVALSLALASIDLCKDQAGLLQLAIKIYLYLQQNWYKQNSN